MQVVIILDRCVAQALRNSRDELYDLRARALLDEVEKFDGSLEPMHPGSSDEQLLKYYIVTVPESVEAEEVRSHIQEMAGVEAAYIKPRDELP